MDIAMPDISEIPSKIWDELKSNPRMIIFIAVGAAIFGSVVPQEIWGGVVMAGGLGLTLFVVFREMKKHSGGSDD